MNVVCYGLLDLQKIYFSNFIFYCCPGRERKYLCTTHMSYMCYNIEVLHYGEEICMQAHARWIDDDRNVYKYKIWFCNIILGFVEHSFSVFAQIFGKVWAKINYIKYAIVIIIQGSIYKIYIVIKWFYIFCF